MRHIMAFVICLALSLLPSSATARDAPPYHQLPFDSLLARQDLVVIGAIVAENVLREDAEWSDHQWFDDFRIRVERVLLGTVEDGTIAVSTPGQVRLQGSSNVGKRVLAWSVREAFDDGRLHGAFCGIDRKGRLVPRPGDDPAFYRLSGSKARHMPRLGDVITRLETLHEGPTQDK